MDHKVETNSSKSKKKQKKKERIIINPAGLVTEEQKLQREGMEK